MNHPSRCCSLALLMLLAAGACAQEIYMCVDSKGRKLTSDRPIAECLDREQKVFGGSGTVKRVVGPVLTARERDAAEETQRRESEEQARISEERRRDRALLARYPTEAAHEQERADALIQVDEVIRAARVRLEDLAKQRKDLDKEMEFYKKDPNKAPGSLKHRIRENELSIAAQQRFLSDQSEERKRTNQRFDDEGAKLRPRWAQAANLGSGPAASSTRP